jgi:hypothetical protein
MTRKTTKVKMTMVQQLAAAVMMMTQQLTAVTNQTNRCLVS